MFASSNIESAFAPDPADAARCSGYWPRAPAVGGGALAEEALDGGELAAGGGLEQHVRARTAPVRPAMASVHGDGTSRPTAVQTNSPPA